MNKQYKIFLLIVMLITSSISVYNFYSIRSLFEYSNFLYQWNVVKRIRADEQSKRLEGLERRLQSDVIPETRVKVGIIDTGLNIQDDIKPFLCKEGIIDLTAQGSNDLVGHGTNVAYLIVKRLNPNKHCIVPLKIMHSEYGDIGASYFSRMLAVVSHVIVSKIRYINFSMGGDAYFPFEKQLFMQMLNAGVTISVAAGNHHRNFNQEHCNFFPACYWFLTPKFHVVGGLKDGQIYKRFNYNGPVNYYEDSVNQTGGGITMSGTSQATANHTGKIVAEENP